MRHDGYASDSAVLDDDDDTWIVNPTSGQVRNSRRFISVFLLLIIYNCKLIFHFTPIFLFPLLLATTLAVLPSVTYAVINFVTIPH